MAEQQLVDYIKKARDAGQTDQQTRNLLVKNGWTESEITDSFNSADQPSAQQQRPQPQSQPQVQPQTQTQPQAQQSQPQPQIQQAQQQPRIQTQPDYKPLQQQTVAQMQSAVQQQIQSQKVQKMPQTRRGGNVLAEILVTLLVLLFVAGGAGFVYSLYSRMYDPSWNPFKPSPAQVMASLMQNMGNTKTISTTAAVQATLLDANSQQQNIAANASGNIDFSDLADTKMDFVINGAENNMEILGANGIFYIKINNAGVPMGDLESIKGQWLKIDSKGQEVLAQQGIELPATKLPAISSLKNAVYQSQMPDQTINGVDCYHYAVKTNFLDLGNMEIWIGKKDYMLYAYKFNKTLDLGQAKLSLKFSSTSLSFNKPVAIEEPTESLEITTVLEPVLRAGQIQADLYKIYSDAQKIYEDKQDYSSLCYKGLLNGYNEAFGTELVELNNNIIKQGGKKVACYASGNNFCTSTQMPDGTYKCQGSTGSGSIQCTSATTDCK